MSDPWQSLGTLRAHLWARLARGAAKADDPFRFTTLATLGAEGPEARIVGLRRAGAGQVEVHSDLRTAKVTALRRDPRAALLFWDPDTQEQLRLSVRLTVFPADPSRWAAIPPEARLNYGTDPAPGTPIDDPDRLTRTPEAARHGTLTGPVLRMDAVSLAHDPHRRAVFEGPDLRGAWVAP
ncbi:pyridoxamine 5'-phosphate oxidase family protein [Jannaschia sp. M317]|uniref:pyridoxamine 5'-phosphate oxidase family protein n=1 Tax=Jannaschia sp. M317 TaxID=2867011 RepID=UPI0021A4D225|nr:pyridoxamine 5'-phosphate oxidase family protein [Jannaschia sp. M317]UWQ19001.1 pyridoxamine 5'-phosphate oxidase family protein [Jannaschia sp. M317]